MKKQKLGIDLDTTLNNLNEVWLKRYNEEYDDNLTEYPTWDVDKHVKPECGQRIFKYLHEKDFFYNLDIRENAVEVIDYLSKYFELYIVTAYSVDTCVDKVRWIEKHLGKIIDVRNVVFCNDKSILNLDYLIDDGAHNILGFKQEGIVYDMSYNKYLDDNFCFPRVSNWLEIKDLFNKKYIKYFRK